jgi:HTH-type transcriptional regulator/antitoxin HigA
LDIRPIRTKEDHEEALREIESIWGAETGTPEGDKLDVLLTLVDAYENIRWPIEDTDPIELIRAHMDATGRSQSDLAILLRSPSRASEILHRKRMLSMDMVYRLSREWGLPADLLVRPYGLAPVHQRQDSSSRAGA